MIAQEMTDTGNRGRVVWILASSRPDLIEVDLKRPGRVDVKVPLLPTSTPAESAQLVGGARASATSWRSTPRTSRASRRGCRRCSRPAPPRRWS